MIGRKFVQGGFGNAWTLPVAIHPFTSTDGSTALAASPVRAAPATASASSSSALTGRRNWRCCAG